MTANFELPVSVREMEACGISGEKLSAFVKAFRRLHSFGFSSEDIADAFYSDARFSTAIETGDLLKARSIIATWIGEGLIAIERAGISEERLWQLTEAGLAVGEISWATRNLAGFKEDLSTGSADDAERRAKLTYELFRRDRTTRRLVRTTRWDGDDAGGFSSGTQPRRWFALYWGVVERCGVGRREMPESFAKASVFGKLADPNYDPLEDLKKEKKAEQKELEARAQSVPQLKNEDVSRERTFWAILILVVVAVTILTAVLSRP